MRQLQEAALDASPAFEHADQLRRRLGEFLSEACGAPVVIERLNKFPAGFSWITYSARLNPAPPAWRAGEKIGGAALDVILRIGPPYGLFAPYSAMPEFNSLSALAASEVPAPRVYFASDDPSIVGAPFFLCEQVEGDTPLPWGSQVQALAEARRESLATDFIDALAALHRFDWRETPLSKQGEAVTLANAAQIQLDSWEARFRRWALRPHPMAHRTLAWLRAHAPRAQRVSLVHGDYRLGNFLERDGRITAILDWELVHLGDPIEDLGWAFLPQYRGGTSRVCGLASEADFIARYEQRSGLKVDPASLKFYLVFSLLKLAFTHMAAARCFEDGRFNDLRMPAMGTQIAPVFRQIGKILEAAA